MLNDAFLVNIDFFNTHTLVFQKVRRMNANLTFKVPNSRRPEANSNSQANFGAEQPRVSTPPITDRQIWLEPNSLCRLKYRAKLMLHLAQQSWLILLHYV